VFVWVIANLRLRYDYRPDSDLYIVYNVGTQFASIVPANPPQVREARFAVKWTYSLSPHENHQTRQSVDSLHRELTVGSSRDPQ